MRKDIALILICLFMASCDFFDLDEVGAEAAVEMHLDYDTLYMMRGDTFSITPRFIPDTVNITDLYIMPVANNIVAIHGNQFEALNEGATQLYFMSVSARLKDSCMVYVSAPWEISDYNYPYETVFYANVTVKGQPMTEGMQVAAFVGKECRAIGVEKEYLGIQMVQFRVGSEYLSGNTNLNWDDFDDYEDDSETDDDTGYVYRERITFRLYDPVRHWIYTCRQREDFDNETHGTLSDLYDIKF